MMKAMIRVVRSAYSDARGRAGRGRDGLELLRDLNAGPARRRWPAAASASSPPAGRPGPAAAGAAVRT